MNDIVLRFFGRNDSPKNINPEKNVFHLFPHTCKKRSTDDAYRCVQWQASNKQRKMFI